MTRSDTRPRREIAPPPAGAAASPIRRWGANFVLVGLIVLFFASFHLVFPTADASNVRLLRKERLAFRDTFVSLEAYVNRYNKASDAEQIRIEEEPFYGSLLAAGFVQRTPAR